ncbi:MAG: DUF294 nucleotidyltransferase-like domain-containing protein [Acidobacteria bacterium]|nr:DUF294 nucleotidyltransferase-like domain-containing protein [Acidobacteriota bacterium]
MSISLRRQPRAGEARRKRVHWILAQHQISFKRGLSRTSGPAARSRRAHRAAAVGVTDIRRAARVVETTEELSNLADAVLRYALGLARQEMDNRYGPPLCTDERGRKTTASFCVVALGKLGSRELNYASDIDLMFLYSDDGDTSGAGERGQTTNREYFNRLAERVSRLVGARGAGEGAAYRVDLRLRPHGRTGALAVSVAEAVRYYGREAQAWELQTLIRSRASAGEPTLYARFDEGVRGRVYTHAGTVEAALANVRRAKQKIDRQHGAEGRGFNVKLGRGGVREIEFIAQALQLAHGGRDEWLRHAPHTLVSLGRLAERGHVTERESSRLSAAYDFLRTLEHRLQMEHGLQTHSVPEDEGRRALVARRMGFEGASALEEFDRELAAHTARVAAAYARVFGPAGEAGGGASSENPTTAAGGVEPTVLQEAATLAGGRERMGDDAPRPARATRTLVGVSGADAEEAALRAAASVFAPRLVAAAGAGAAVERDAEDADEVGRVAKLLGAEATASLNPRRAATLLARVAASLDKSDSLHELTESCLRALARLCGASELFGEMIAANPALIRALAPGGVPEAGDAAREADDGDGRDFRAHLRAAVDAERSFRAELGALRHEWARLVLEIGARDVAGALALPESNRWQTELAAASVNVALLVARREMARRFGALAAGPRLSVLGLGRLASGGMDYGSDLDIVIVYDERVPSPVRGLARGEAYARLCELMTAALSSVTREGHLYRVDLRLRPDGQNGPVARGADSFVDYLAARTDVWELLAYVKLRAVGGDLELGRAVEERARRAVHEAAGRADAEELRTETRRVRERLERERASRASGALDIKYGAGGMLDVYFAARYLQLRDRLPDGGDDRSTAGTLDRLLAQGSLGAGAHAALREGYALLRALDHHLRIIAGRSTRLPSAPDHPTLRDLARALRFDTPRALVETLRASMASIRAAYDRVTGEG